MIVVTRTDFVPPYSINSSRGVESIFDIIGPSLAPFSQNIQLDIGIKQISYAKAVDLEVTASALLADHKGAVHVFLSIYDLPSRVGVIRIMQTESELVDGEIIVRENSGEVVLNNESPSAEIWVLNSNKTQRVLYSVFTLFDEGHLKIG